MDNNDLPYIPVSIGELYDKITILEIKEARISDPTKVANVSQELKFLISVADRFRFDGVGSVTQELKQVNEQLWEVEDAVRDHEKREEFGGEFVTLARSVYKLNDQRASLKKQINLLSGSRLVEEKSY
jgi:hypothetical protein